MTTLDWLASAGYFALLAGLVWMAVRRTRQILGIAGFVFVVSAFRRTSSA